MSDQLPVRRTILAVDVEGFTRPERDDPSRSDLRNALAKMLEAALLRCGVDTQATTRLDTGDGACVLLDPNVSEVTLLEECVAELGVGLKNYNRGRLPEAMLRLRMVLPPGMSSPTTMGGVANSSTSRSASWMPSRFVRSPEHRRSLGGNGL